MERYAQITQAIYEAMDQVNEMWEPGRALEKAPDTVLTGAAATLDSQSFVELAVALEEQIERAFNTPISVIDVLFPDETETLTVATLAKRIADLIGQAPRAHACPVAAEDPAHPLARSGAVMGGRS